MKSGGEGHMHHQWSREHQGTVQKRHRPDDHQLQLGSDYQCQAAGEPQQRRESDGNEIWHDLLYYA